MSRLARSLHSVEPFARLTTGELGSLDKFGTVFHAKANDIICEAGATADGAIVLISGEVSAERSDGTSTHKGPGPLLATGALLSDRPHDHTLTALTDVEAIKLERGLFEKLCLERHPLGRTVLMDVVSQLVERVRVLNQTLNDLLT